MREHPHALWAALYYCCQSRFDYWLRHVPPRHTAVPAANIDAALLHAFSTLTYAGCPDDRITRRRIRLPARLRGCGLRERHALAPIAFAACVIEAAEQAIDRATDHGGPRHARGHFAHLEPAFGAGAFDPGGHRFSRFIQSGLVTAGEWADAWETIRRRTQGSEVRGPLTQPIGQAGHGCGTHLQRQITEQIEQIERDALHRDILLLPRTDTRRIAWLAVDRLSSQWVPAWPTRTVELSRAEMPEVMTTYLGRESPALRHLAGRFIPCTHTSRGGRGGRGRVCDAYGFQLGLATLPGTSDTACHDEAGRELFDILREARLPIDVSSSSRATHIFALPRRLEI